MKNYLSAFSGGLWIIPVLLFIALVVSFYRGYLQSKSGSLQEGPTSGSTVESNINIPFWKCTATKFGIGFTLALIAVIIGIIHEA